MVLPVRRINADRGLGGPDDLTQCSIVERWIRCRFNEPRSIAMSHNLVQTQAEQKGLAMQIKLTSVYVDDQDKALKFYTEVLGFQKKFEFPAGKHKWLTVVSAEEPEGVQLVLEPNDGWNPAAKSYQQETHRSGVAAANFFVGDVEKEYQR